MIVRPVAPTDAAQLGPLFAQWGHALPATAIGVVLTDWEQTPLAELLVAEIDATIAGLAGVVSIPHLGRRGRFARLMGLVVGSAHRRQGVGAALMQAVETYARAWECDPIELTSSRSRVAAHDFYRALGYADQSDLQARYLRKL